MVLSAMSERDTAPGQAPIISEPALSVIMWIGVALSACFVVFRTVVQYQSSKRFFVNDYWIFFAMLCHIITAILYQVAIPPMYELSYVGAQLKPITAGFVNRADLFLRLQFALDMMLWTTLWSVKFSLLFFFWRLFDSVQTPMKIFWWIMCAVTASTWIISVVLQQFACDPIKDFFTLGKCASTKDIFYSNLIFHFSVSADIAGDVFVMLIPFPLLRKLQISSRQRWILVAIFFLPIIPIIFAILRLVKANATTHNVDPIRFQLYSMLENTSAIVTSCLPSIRLFVVSARGTTHSRSSHYYSRGVVSSLKANDQNSFHGPQKGAIPLETMVEAQDGHIVEDLGTVGRALSGDSEEEILSPHYSKMGMLVTREFNVTRE